MFETNIADSFVKLLQNLNIEEMRQVQDQDLENKRREVLLMLEYLFKLNSQYIALRAQVHNVKLISFNEAQNLPEYQAELASIRSSSFFSLSTSMSDHDIEKYSKIMAFINFTEARDKYLSHFRSEAEALETDENVMKNKKIFY